jgi:CheY-like chemotaxis protein
MILNADQAMPDGGTVTISVRNVVIKDPDNLPLRSGAHILVSIKDSGIGMNADLKDKIFDPYFTTKQEGSGLGLTSCYSIIKKHEGHITVESAPGEGATFHIYLPASGNTGAAVETGPHEKTIRPGKGKILLMDDDAVVRNIARDIIEFLGYDAECVSDGKEAIDVYVRAKESGRPFDAIIMDLTVPGGMGGKDAVTQLLAIDPQVKAIVSSGYSMDPIMADYRAYGFCSVVAKPYKIEELSATLQQVIGGA